MNVHTGASVHVGCLSSVCITVTHILITEQDIGSCQLLGSKIMGVQNHSFYSYLNINILKVIELTAILFGESALQKQNVKICVSVSSIFLI